MTSTTDEHLSQIITTWTVLFQAHAEESTQAAVAQQKLLERYGGAVYRYLLAAVRDQDAAEDLFQEFALRFVRGAFRNAHPEKGKFRKFLKTALYNLVMDHHRKAQRRMHGLSPNAPEPADPSVPEEQADREFLEIWRKELMNRTWAALEEEERQTGRPLHTVLRHRTDHPEHRSADMAEHFTPILGRPLNAQWVRKQLYLARERFTDLLLDEVARSLQNPSEAELEEELGDLELLEHCKDALARRRERRG